MESDTNFQPVPITRFDTSLISSKERYDAWNQNMGVLFGTLTPERHSLPVDIHAQINAGNLGEALFGTTRSCAQLFERDERRVARTGLDHILVQVFLKGGTTIDNANRLGQGDIVIMDLDQPHQQINSDFEVLTLVLPRALDPKLSQMLAPLHGRRLGNETPMAGFLGDHLKAFWHHLADMDTGLANVALHGTLGLMKGWLEHEQPLDEEGPSEVSAELGKAIRRYIDCNLSEPLSPAEIIAKFRISRTHLYRLFADCGGIMSYVLERRLRFSLRMLTGPSYTNQSIGEIGFNCGFSSESYFSRAFRARFGITPTEARFLGAEAAEVHPLQDGEGPTDSIHMLPKLMHELGVSAG